MILQPARPFGIDTTTVSRLAIAVPGVLYGWGFQETTELARADLELSDGPAGPPIVPISLSAGQSTRDWLGGFGLECQVGVYLTVVAGTVKGSLWFRPTFPDDPPHVFDLAGGLDMLVEMLLRG